MISAVSNHGAASSAKRIINTAPMAKFGAMNAFAALAPNKFVISSRSSSLKPVVPTTACTSCAAHHLRFSRAAATTVKSTLTSVAALISASGVGAIVRSVPATCSPAC